MSYVIDPPEQTAVNVQGGGQFPVRRIFCIGRNYAEHVREMGGDPKSNPPVFFTKPADAIVSSGAEIPFPQATTDLHYEGELVVALKSGGRELSPDETQLIIFGYAAGCDLTRRDHQRRAKNAGAPWDTAKGFDNAAPIGEITPAVDSVLTENTRLTTFVNGEKRQDAPLTAMIWSIGEIIAALSRQFELKPGDLIFTGTPEGVGPLTPGDVVKVAVGEALMVEFSIVAAES